jgi:hypothetical protein
MESTAQRQIINQMIVDWRAAHYRLEVQHRVAKTIGDPKEHLEGLRKELERCERAIDALQGLLAEIPE